MEQIDQATVAAAILNAPGLAHIGITAPSAWMRKDAALELARVISAAPPAPSPGSRDAQAALPL